MGIFGREKPVAPLWLRAASFSSIDVDFSPRRRDLEVRQNGLEVRQKQTKCPTEYTTQNGMRFATYCDTNIADNSTLYSFKADKMEHCMNHCARYFGGANFCSGITWRESDRTCWLRNNTESTAKMEATAGVHAALANSEDTKPLPNECPGEYLSTYDLGNGMSYTLHCDKFIQGFDTCWAGYANCKPAGSFEGFHHATSLEECLQLCAKEHPLCRAVHYNPTLELGYANCWPKTGWPENGLSNPIAGTFHSATITSIELIDTKCPEEKTLRYQENSWDIQCGKSSAGSNLTSVHAQNLTGCIEACATHDKGCIGVVFDSTLLMGYSNCYMKNTTSVIQDKAEVTYAVLAGSPLPTSDPPNDPGENNNDGSSSQAWIAGPIAGGIVGLALIAFAIWWWRRRKSRQLNIPHEMETTPYTTQYKHVAPTELMADHRVEMAALPTYGSEKRPQELPG